MVYPPEDAYKCHASMAEPVILALIAWTIHNVTQGWLARWAMYLVILFTWALLLAAITHRKSYQSTRSKPTAENLSYEVPDATYDAVQRYLEGGCPQTRCLHNIWLDYKPDPTADTPLSDDDEQKPPTIWDGKVDFSCTSSEAELLPRDSITQLGITGWHIRTIMSKQNKNQKRRLESLVKLNELTSGFPKFQDWPRDPSLSYQQNWDKWYNARQEHRRFHPLSEEEIAEEKRKREQQAEKMDKWWHDKNGGPRPQTSLAKTKPQASVKICVMAEEGTVERVIGDANGSDQLDDTWKGIEDGYKKPVVDEGLLWPHWRPRNGSAESTDETFADEGENFEGLWAGFANGQDGLKQPWVADDYETY
ncbi:hypothetical protein B0T21DRAFT_354269 [Apiosordaria backusii]|uniref:Uncharacterized protein n=1 Tax=Apiosordaria backusii TaxID=314023 RepID=A0AA40EXJ8_9PEZI|nr:hypothetical protein B0T21DRAFT_354269 [Apiosordaria backusii]